MGSLVLIAITPAVAVVSCFAEHFRIVLLEDASNVGGTAIAQRQSVWVENLMVFIIVWEVFPDKLDEQFTNNRSHISAVLWVEPYNFSVSIFSKVLSMVIVKRHWWKMFTIL